MCLATALGGLTCPVMMDESIWSLLAEPGVAAAAAATPTTVAATAVADDGCTGVAANLKQPPCARVGGHELAATVDDDCIATSTASSGAAAASSSGDPASGTFVLPIALFSQGDDDGASLLDALASPSLGWSDDDGRMSGSVSYCNYGFQPGPRPSEPLAESYLRGGRAIVMPLSTSRTV